MCGGTEYVHPTRFLTVAAAVRGCATEPPRASQQVTSGSSGFADRVALSPAGAEPRTGPGASLVVRPPLPLSLASNTCRPSASSTSAAKTRTEDVVFRVQAARSRALVGRATRG
jgi:hypothetical protein